MSETVSLRINENTVELPVITGAEGEKAIDISKLRDQTGYITLDPGFKNTGATKSAITFWMAKRGSFGIGVMPLKNLLKSQRLSRWLTC